MLWTMELEEFCQTIFAANSSGQNKTIEESNESPVPTTLEEYANDPLLNSIRPLIGGPVGEFIKYVMTGVVGISLVLAGAVIFGLPFYGEYLEWKRKNKELPAIVQYEPAIIQEKTVPLENIIWEFETKSQIRSAVMDSGLIYLSTNDSLCALNAKTGELKWEEMLGGEQVNFAIPYGDAVFCCGQHGIYKLDAEKGIQTRPVFSSKTLNRLISNTDSGKLFFVNEDYDLGYHHKIFTLDVKTGNTASLCSGDSMITTPPFAFKDKVYFCTGTGRIHCIDVKTGNQLWKYLLTAENPTGGMPHTDILPLLAANDKYLFVSANGDMQALDLETGKQAWLFHPTGICQYSNFILNGISAPCVSGNSVFIQDSFNLYALDAETGNVKWKAGTQRVQRPEFLEKHVPIFYDKKIYARATVINEPMYCIRVFNAETGEKERVIEFNAEITSNPVFQDNMMYVGINSKNKHKLISIDLEK